MNPNIELLDLNTCQNGKDLYTVILKDRELALQYTIGVNSDANAKNAEFEIIKCDYLRLSGVTNVEKYLTKTKNDTSLSANIYIIESIFDDILKDYGIKLNKILFHSYSYFDAVDGSFEMSMQKKEIIKKMINNKLKKYFKLV